MSGWMTNLLNGMGAYLDDGGAGTWSPSSVFTDDQIGIVVDAIPQTPTRLITLTGYLIDAMPGLADVRVGVQVRVRGDANDPRVRNDIADACYEVLHGLQKVTWGGISVVQVYWQTWAPIGQDANHRYERADTYHVDAMRPTSLNPD